MAKNGMPSRRDLLLVKSGGKRPFLNGGGFTELEPSVEVRCWDDKSVDPDAETLVLVWQPQLSQFAHHLQQRCRRGSHNLRSEIAAALSDYQDGKHRDDLDGREYVCLAVLAIHRDLKRIIVSQAACRWDEFEPPRTALDMQVGSTRRKRQQCRRQ